MILVTAQPRIGIVADVWYMAMPAVNRTTFCVQCVYKTTHITMCVVSVIHTRVAPGIVLARLALVCPAPRRVHRRGAHARVRVIAGRTHSSISTRAALPSPMRMSKNT